MFGLRNGSESQLVRIQTSIRFNGVQNELGTQTQIPIQMQQMK